MKQRLVICILIVVLLPICFLGFRVSQEENKKVSAVRVIIVDLPDRSIVEMTDSSLWVMARERPDSLEDQDYFFVSFGWRARLDRLVSEGYKIKALYPPDSPEYPEKQKAFFKQ